MMNRDALIAPVLSAPVSGLLAGLLLALGGCSVMPTYHQPESAVQAPLAQAQGGWHLAAGGAAAAQVGGRNGSKDVSGPDGSNVANDANGSNGTKGSNGANAASATGTGTGAARADGTGSASGAGAGRGEPAGTARGVQVDAEGFGLAGQVDARLFGDPQLETLLAQLRTGNLSVQQAEARLRAAQAVLSGAGASRLPQLGVDASGSLGSASARNSSQTGSSSTGSSSTGSDAASSTTGTSSSRNSVQNQVEAGARISWAPDLWGTVAAQIEAGKASLQMAEADRRAALLQAEISLVQAWWRMRLADARLALLSRSIQATERSLALTRNQYQSGLVARADVVQAETRLQSVVTRRHALARSRDTERHAIAVLLGQPPSALPAITPAPLPAVPALPDTLAIDLLRRRPDVRAAERQVAAANAEIGVARGAWLPTLSFSGTYGLGAENLANLISSPLRTWSLGTQLAATLFDGGARQAALRQKQAAYDERVAAYRQQVLTAVQEVEDGLLALRTQAAQAQDQTRLLDLATESERVVRNRYRAGMVSYLELATAETTRIDAEDEAVSLQAERLASYTSLLGALGGSW